MIERIEKYEMLEFVFDDRKKCLKIAYNNVRAMNVVRKMKNLNVQIPYCVLLKI